MVRIGPRRFLAICSDNTGNTTSGRKFIVDEFGWIIILPDCCHRMNSLCKDISKIEFFKPTIKKIRRVIKYFRKSTYAAAHLRRRRRAHHIKRGLQSVGKTRFGTLYHSGASLRRCLQPIRELATENIVTIPVSLSFWL